MPDEFTLKISRLGERTDSVIKRALDAGGEVVLSQVRGNLAAVIGNNTKLPSKSTGELLASLGVTPVGIDSKGDSNLKVGFNEPRRVQLKTRGKKGKFSAKKGSLRSYVVSTNAMVANVLEYGRHGQPPRPFMKPARRASRKPCLEAMKAAVSEAVNSL